MADRDRAGEPQDEGSTPASVGPEHDTTASAYAPPERRPGAWRNPAIIAVVAVVVVALVVYAVLLR